MRHVAWLVLFAGACGRFGFAPEPDAPPPCTLPGTHDEDADGVTDACDACPHLVDDQADGDGDGVGDACDPEPALARQRIVVFDPFTTLDPAWTDMANAAIDGDELVIGKVGAAMGGVLRRPLVPAHDLFVVGGSAGAAGATGQHLFLISTARAATPGSYYCELYDSGAGTTLFVTVTYDANEFTHPDGMPMPDLENGDGTFSYEHGPTEMRCGATWEGMDGVAASVRPTDIPVDVLMIYAENLVMRLRYFVQIRTAD